MQASHSKKNQWPILSVLRGLQIYIHARPLIFIYKDLLGFLTAGAPDSPAQWPALEHSKGTDRPSCCTLQLIHRETRFNHL